MRTGLGFVLSIVGICAVLPARFSAAEKNEGLLRVVWQGPGVNTLGAPSRGGRWLSFVDSASGDLAARELHNGAVRFITRKNPENQSGEFAYFSVTARDEKTVAFAWFNEERFYELRLSEIPGEGDAVNPPRVLYRNREAGFVQPCAFSPDGKQVLTLFFRRDNISQIALVSTADGAVRTLKSLNWIYPKRMDFSPDGRWVVYDNASSDGAQERDIFALAVDGSREHRLLSGPDNDLFPLWSPDGEEIVFSRERPESTGVWAIGIKEGKPVGEPRLLRDELGRILPLGLTDAGELYFGRRSGRSDVYMTSLDSPNFGEPLIADTPGRNFGATFSNDGSTLAYLSRRGSENYGLEQRAVLLYPLKEKKSKELPVRLAHVERIAWSSDDARLLLAGSDRRTRGGLFEFDLETGRTTPVILDAKADYRGIEAAYASSAGDVVYIRSGSPQALVSHRRADQSEQILYQASPHATIASPALSPDAKSLAFAELQTGGSGTSDVLILELASGDVKRLLTLPSGRLTDITWLPDRRALLVGTEGRSGAQLWRVSAAGDSIKPAMLAPKRQPGVSVGPGSLAAVTIGDAQDEIWVLEQAVRANGDQRRGNVQATH